ncbi:uncharacterized protein PFL1_00644 [Pseudozyma flocculosa PF-1]|uniref:NADH dehydrogenase [ubiquinone] 1 alpha subcomplex assembly factor 3 n=1 Tax=Pseudozyma flocculosa TaxID=84751 RepID=A0A5C3ES84_9BASI|nr:uncharacterized protein PFL1_00644 [Pseudozyma flocculosa PF-1]EPQ32448.1 hypothetical protein PFL1_00644 [Pseudozyma flocculosa PF-1]SPO34565.1 uncharacterized protein PSFLO_00036 [Pseudozyma flocculosa]
MLRRLAPSLARPLVVSRCVPALPRALSTTPYFARPSQDPGGKPNDGSHRTVYDDFHNILDSSLRPSLSIHSTSDETFTLQDGLVLSTPIVLLNNQVFMWNAPPLDPMRATPGGLGWDQWSEEDVWRVFKMVDDRPEILLFGTGKTVLPPPASVRKLINDLGIQLDVQNTRNACSTFNLLAEEGRKVAAALLPPKRTPIEKVTPQQLQMEESDYLH